MMESSAFKTIVYYYIFFVVAFSFLGHTGDYAEMMTNLEKRYPNTTIVSVGFSLGGNIVTKYMGEHASNLPNNIIGGISICQGYNAVE